MEKRTSSPPPGRACDPQLYQLVRLRCCHTGRAALRDAPLAEVRGGFPDYSHGISESARTPGCSRWVGRTAALPRRPLPACCRSGPSAPTWRCRATRRRRRANDAGSTGPGACAIVANGASRTSELFLTPAASVARPCGAA